MSHPADDRAPLSPLESEIMDFVWRRGRVSAGEVHAHFARQMTNPSVRTLLRRIEAKGFLTHTREGRAFIYTPKVGADAVARGALRKLLDRFYAGSVEQLLAGLVDGRMTDRRALRALADRVAAAEKSRTSKRS
jgi:predicted transcriptional regulator